MLYDTSKNPKKAFIIVVLTSLIGIIGGYFFHAAFTMFALIFWMHYTLVLSFLQIEKKSKHDKKSITEFLLNPWVRFLLFEIIAGSSLILMIIYENVYIGITSLVVWVGFAFNFYMHYKK